MPLEREDRAVVDMMRKVSYVLEEFGANLSDPNFRDTPFRFLKYLSHYFQPYNPAIDLGVEFPVQESLTASSDYKHGLVVQTGIPYHAICAHHLLPVLGTAHVAYLPQHGVVGLSKLDRLVYGLSHAQPSLQEDVGAMVVDALMSCLEPLGAMCVISAEHGCMAARGVEEPTGCVKTLTASVAGIFEDNLAARDEVYRLIELGRR